MKKIFTLALASLFTVAVFAADRRPSVTIQANRNYELVIDGKSYISSNGGMMSIGNLRDGYHTVTVYSMNQGFFRKMIKRQLSSSSFMLRGNDINILVDQFGRIQVKEDLRFRNNRNGRGWDDKDYGRDNNSGRDNNYDRDNGRKDQHGRF
jgi:hypothetical protein